MVRRNLGKNRVKVHNSADNQSEVTVHLVLDFGLSLDGSPRSDLLLFLGHLGLRVGPLLDQHSLELHCQGKHDRLFAPACFVLGQLLRHVLEGICDLVSLLLHGFLSFLAFMQLLLKTGLAQAFRLLQLFKLSVF